MLLVWSCVAAYVVKPRVFVHLERFNTKYNLFHVGISFVEEHRVMRYDFRARNEMAIPPKLSDELFEHPAEGLETRDYFWGETNKTMREIFVFEEEHLQKRYILGLYDCRHYVAQFAEWCMDKPTPIWNLKDLWEE